MQNKRRNKNIVLIVDDDKNILESLKMLLIHSGFHVETAANGEIAFLLLNNINPDIILLDITMPQMDGFEFCKILKENSETKDIPVIFLTGVGSEIGTRLQSLMVGAIDYITKPYESDELIQKIQLHVEQNKKGKQGE